MSRLPTPLIERFERQVARDKSGCWLWQGTVSALGYGRITRADFSKAMAHRVAYELYVGPIPAGLELDHLCRVRSCVNPDHLEAVTRRENVLRSKSFAGENAAKSRCIHGHEFTPENTYTRPGSRRRECRACQSERRPKVSKNPVRAWAKAQGIPVTVRGRIPAEIVAAYETRQQAAA